MARSATGLGHIPENACTRCTFVHLCVPRRRCDLRPAHAHRTDRPPHLLPDGMIPVGPSPVAGAGQVLTQEGMQGFVTPEELIVSGIVKTINDFVRAARHAITAGFDGVELHGANGYLLHWFLSTGANRRTDGWGGSRPGLHPPHCGGGPRGRRRHRGRPRRPADLPANAYSDTADMIAFGTFFVANPDLPARLRRLPTSPAAPRPPANHSHPGTTSRNTAPPRPLRRPLQRLDLCLQHHSLLRSTRADSALARIQAGMRPYLRHPPRRPRTRHRPGPQ